MLAVMNKSGVVEQVSGSCAFPSNEEIAARRERKVNRERMKEWREEIRGISAKGVFELAKTIGL